MARYNLYRCTNCSMLYADAGKPRKCEHCTGSSASTSGTSIQRIDPEDVGVFPARDR